MALTDYTFRVQALGGKFLADDIGGAHIVVRDELGRILDEGITQGDSGTLIGPPPSPPPPDPTWKQVEASSKNQIVYPGGSGSWWLVPATTTSKFVAQLDLERPTKAHVVARGPLGGLQSAAEVHSTFWLFPGKAAPALPGYVIEIPGLVVQPLTPQIHTQVVPGAKFQFLAKVTMMCGCQITKATAEQATYWPSSDFEVVATVKQSGVAGAKDFSMEITASASVFQSNDAFEVPGQGSGTSFWEVTFTAFQRSTGNAGSAVVNFYCTY